MILVLGFGELMITGVVSNSKLFWTGCRKSNNESSMASTVLKGETL